MNWLKLVFIIALTIVFIGSAFMSIFGGGEITSATLKTYVFKVERCTFESPMAKSLIPNSDEVLPEPIEICKIDYNNAKRDIADGLAKLIIAGPIAFVLGRNLKKLVIDNK